VRRLPRILVNAASVVSCRNVPGNYCRVLTSVSVSGGVRLKAAHSTGYTTAAGHGREFVVYTCTGPTGLCAIAGTNNDLVWTANTGGTAGNSIRIAYVVAGTNTPLSVSVAGNDITVNVATNGASAATSTAAQVAAAVAASSAAGRLVTGTNAAGNDGTGVVAAMGLTNLTGGTDYVVGRA